MSKPRKRWKIVDNFTDRSMESKAAAYRYVENVIREWGVGSRRQDLPTVRVYVDERDGNGWRLYERVNLSNLRRQRECRRERRDS